MFPLLLAAAVLLLLAYFGRAVVAWARMFWMARKIPGPAVGALRFVGPTKDVFEKAVVVHREYGTTVRFWAFPVVNVTLSEPEDLEVVFTRPDLQNKPAFICGVVSPILGKGLVTLNADEHRYHRKAIGPSLHLEILQVGAEVGQEHGAGW